MSFLLLGLALLGLDYERPSGRRPAQHAALVVAFSSLLGVTGYGYGAETHRVYSYIPMALNTAVAFGLAAVGTLAARPASGFVALLTTRQPIGMLGRRVLVAALTVPWAIGWGGLQLERIGFFGHDQGVAFLAVSTMAVMSVAAWWALRSLDRAEQRRAAAVTAQQQSDHRLRALLHHAPTAIYVTDADGRVRFVNPRFESVFRVRGADVEGRIDTDVFPASYAKAYRAHDTEVLASRRAIEFEEHVPQEDGLHTYLATKFPLVDDAGAPYALCGILADVTARKAAEGRAARLQARIGVVNRVLGTFATATDDRLYREVLEALCEAFESPVGLVVAVDADGRFVCAGGSARIGPCTAEPLEAPDSWTGPWGRVFRERRCLYDNAAHRLPPDLSVTRSVGAPVVFAGEMIGVVHLADRTHDYGDDDASLLAEIAAAMAPALGVRLTRLLQLRERQQAADDQAGLNHQLAAANRELEAFSYSVSHDLRAPLRAIDGFARILVEDHGPKLEPEALRALDIVCDNAQRMGRLIDDLLALSRLGRKDLVRQTFDVAALARAVVEETARLEPERVVTVSVGDLPPAVADGGMLRQVFANLVGNAFKYTRRTSDPRVEIGSAREPDGIVYFVRDNGTGFDMRYTDKLFKVFQRLHRAEEFDGTGIGLATVQRIVQRHGGRAWAEGAVGRGATFYFTLGAGPEVTDESGTDRPG